MKHLRTRRQPGGDEGVYAILYALLVVVLIGMSAIVVDFASVRSDRRLDRSASDSAVLGAAEFLDPQGLTGISPYDACQHAWDYLTTTLRLSSNPGRIVGVNACTPFLPANLTTGTVSGYCALASPPEIDADWPPTGSIEGRVFRIAWPVPSTGGSGFMKPDLAPGSATQVFSAAADGSVKGCDRIGLAVFHDEDFGLAGVLGATGTTTQVHSVARFSTVPSDNPEVAALNVLNRTACEQLDTGGQGDVLVNRAIDSRNPTRFGQGIIAMESTGATCGVPTVLDVSSSVNNRVCASGPAQVPSAVGTCDGQGLIVMHALDPGGRKAYPGAPGAPTSPITPTPQAEGGIAQWKPVTDIYGCRSLPNRTIPAIDCSSYSPNYMNSLLSLYATGTPTTAYTGVGSYTGTSYGAFRTLPGAALPAFTCNPDNLYIPAGNWFINCPDGAQAGFALRSNNSKVVFGGGHIVFTGGIDAAKNGACLAFNVPISPAPAPGSVTCPATANLQSSTATTVPAPTQDAIVVSRGSRSISTGSSSTTLLLPQTLVVQTGSGGLDLGGGTGLILWSAPGGGTRTAGVSRLSNLCSDNTDCLASHFEKIAYWSEGTALDSVGGQGSVTYVGVFFAPIAPWEFKGQGGGAGTNAQFWADTIALSGQAKLYLTPDLALAVPRPLNKVSLIR